MDITLRLCENECKRLRQELARALRSESDLLVACRWFFEQMEKGTLAASDIFQGKEPLSEPQKLQPFVVQLDKARQAIKSSEEYLKVEK